MSKTKTGGIKFDRNNYRTHDESNKRMIRESLEACGAGRSVLVDNQNELIAGNGVYEQAQKLGIPTRIIETDGTELVVVKRTDLEPEDKKRKQLAAADNAIADKVTWNAPAIRADFTPVEIQALNIDLPPVEIQPSPDDFGTEFKLPEGDKQPFQQMTFILHDEQAAAVKRAIAAVKETDAFKYVETYGNSNTNGNALYCLIMQWLENNGTL